MKGINISFANEKSPVPGTDWAGMTDRERIELVQDEMIKFDSDYTVTVVDAKKDGQIALIINDQLSAKERGTFLLDMEAHLKESVDNGLTVWHEPIGDKSSLRNLRGIEVKS